jgi:hypothetical protein
MPQPVLAVVPGVALTEHKSNRHSPLDNMTVLNNACCSGAGMLGDWFLYLLE